MGLAQFLTTKFLPIRKCNFVDQSGFFFMRKWLIESFLQEKYEENVFNSNIQSIFLYFH